jgi:hypothetical protein
VFDPHPTKPGIGVAGNVASRPDVGVAGPQPVIDQNPGINFEAGFLSQVDAWDHPDPDHDKIRGDRRSIVEHHLPGSDLGDGPTKVKDHPALFM